MVAFTELKLMNYLLFRNLIGDKDLDSLKILSVPNTRNNVFVVLADDVKFLIKQPMQISNLGFNTFSNEINASHFMRKVMPTITSEFFSQNTDCYNRVLFFEYDPNYSNLKEFIQSSIDFNEVVKVLKEAFKISLNKYSHKYGFHDNLKLLHFKPIFIKENTDDLFKLLLNAKSKMLAKFCLIYKNELKEIGNLWEERKDKNTIVLHCDLRPENILISNDNPSTYKLIDWELSCYGDKLWDPAYFVGFLFYDNLINTKIIVNRSTLHGLLLFAEANLEEESSVVFRKYFVVVLLLFVYERSQNDNSSILKVCEMLLKDSTLLISNTIVSK